ncbi:hypothetical protein [Priestia megaterium]|uniref:hypothetical protein n=1 Tax=Priestia megaterium TaxID=1404 RepID=UPI001BEAE639|nr:hypothetical protein [Priestia megaterium]MBT2253992.1 hypothetical protein [Priestia megaterium]MBT2279245.1 hypothetical protein [Priestia megaterium]
MVTKGLTFSALVKDLIALPTPCNDVVYYPANLSTLGVQEKYAVFQTSSRKSGLAYMTIIHPDRAKFILASSRASMHEVYKAIPWPEFDLGYEEGTFYYKIAPSLQEVEFYFNNLKKQ